VPSAALALILGPLLGLLWPADALHATPTPPVLIVNGETRECSQVIQGDDCSWCDLPAGWEILGPAGQTSCPEGYAQVANPGMECRLYETPFCCSGGVHRGYCEDMVIDHDAATCGFVRDIQGCRLPESWQSRPATVNPAHWSCPPGYAWTQEAVDCLAESAGAPSGVLDPEATDALLEEDAETTRRWICSGLACLVFVAVLFGLAAMFPVWYVARQKERRTLPPSGKR
jgi:hypothetical protein